MNSDCWVMSEAICLWYEVKSENHWQIASIVIHDNECIILSFTLYSMSWTHNAAKNNYRSLISPLSFRTVFADLALWRHHSWFVTSRVQGVLSRVLASWRQIRPPSCTCKLVQRQSSLENKKREYQFLTTWYSWRSMYEKRVLVLPEEGFQLQFHMSYDSNYKITRNQIQQTSYGTALLKLHIYMKLLTHKRHLIFHPHRQPNGVH